MTNKGYIGIFIILATLMMGCASKKLHIDDWSFGTRTHGQIEAAGKDFYVVRFTKIEVFGYSLDEYERKIDLLKIYRCEFVSWCDYKVGTKVYAEARGGKRMKDPISYELNFLKSAEQDDVPLVRSFRSRP
ncbi:MAG: hypothetical protein AAB799_00075 [Patescibacteria group bacterium]